MTRNSIKPGQSAVDKMAFTPFDGGEADAIAVRRALTIRELPAPTIPEPPRRGEHGGPPCGICSGGAASAVWSDDLWTVHPPVGGSLPGTVWLASREHADSFGDLSDATARAFGPMAARVERAILGLGGFARVHLYRWGDGGAHFHVWFLPRPLGMLDASGMMLPLWEDVLPKRSDNALRVAAEKVAAWLDGDG